MLSAKALSNLKNMCRVCNSALDEPKPVKPLEKEEEIRESQAS